ncbi:MAG: hypothetical protein BM555_00795 [Crocinitomix sp. MedPE-SWsnd]|nr:MAG: hypothetical protein BM555_00795 [Crocinitomix sp. MedPE-SWsnd]
MKIKLTLFSAIALLLSSFSFGQELQGSSAEGLIEQETGIFIEDEASNEIIDEAEVADVKKEKVNFRDALKEMKKDLKQSLKAQKKISKERKSKGLSGSGMSEVAMILLVILAIILPWLAVGLYTGWDTMLTLVSVLLWLLFWIPGIVFAFLVIFDVI